MSPPLTCLPIPCFGRPLAFGLSLLLAFSLAVGPFPLAHSHSLWQEGASAGNGAGQVPASPATAASVLRLLAASDGVTLPLERLLPVWQQQGLVARWSNSSVDETSQDSRHPLLVGWSPQLGTTDLVSEALRNQAPVLVWVSSAQWQQRQSNGLSQWLRTHGWPDNLVLTPSTLPELNAAQYTVHPLRALVIGELPAMADPLLDGKRTLALAQWLPTLLNTAQRMYWQTWETRRKAWREKLAELNRIDALFWEDADITRNLEQRAGTAGQAQASRFARGLAAIQPAEALRDQIATTLKQPTWDEQQLKALYQQALTAYQQAWQWVYPQRQPGQLVGVWLDRGTLVRMAGPVGLKQQLADYAEAGITDIFVESLNAGYPVFDSQTLPQKNPLLPQWDPLATAIEEGHRLGLRVHAWVWVFAVGNRRHNPLVGLPEHYPGPILSQPQWKPLQLQFYQPKEVAHLLPSEEFWLSPSNPEARALLLSAFEELVRRYPVDGLHLDYIRYPFQNNQRLAGMEPDSLRQFYRDYPPPPPPPPPAPAMLATTTTLVTDPTALAGATPGVGTASGKALPAVTGLQPGTVSPATVRSTSTLAAAPAPANALAAPSSSAGISATLPSLVVPPMPVWEPPLDVPPVRRDLWQEWKTQQVSTFVKAVSGRVRMVRPNIILSAAVFAIPRPKRLQMIQQDWEYWLEQGWLDWLTPMTYTEQPAVLQQQLGSILPECRRSGRLLLAGVGLHKVSDLEWLQQMRLMQKQGTNGQVVFAAAQLTPERLSVLARTAPPAALLQRSPQTASSPLPGRSAPHGGAVPTAFTVSALVPQFQQLLALFPAAQQPEALKRAATAASVQELAQQWPGWYTQVRQAIWQQYSHQPGWSSFLLGELDRINLLARYAIRRETGQRVPTLAGPVPLVGGPSLPPPLPSSQPAVLPVASPLVEGTPLSP